MTNETLARLAAVTLASIYYRQMALGTLPKVTKCKPAYAQGAYRAGVCH
jgi:hypothetical protein